MTHKCEDCGETFEGGEYARYCRRCRLKRTQAGMDRHMAEVRAGKVSQKPKWKPNRFTCLTCRKHGTTCKTPRVGTHNFCWVGLDGETAATAMTKPKIETLPPAAPREKPKREKAADRIGLYRQLAEDAGMSYGKWVALTPEKDREAAWRKFRAGG